MGRLIGYPFNDTFGFSRAVAAPVRNAGGDLVTVAPDVPRFDHSEAGARIGLLVTPGETLGQVDRCAVVAGDWEVEGPATVLHEYADLDGTIVRRAFYTDSVRATVDVVLRVHCHHRIIGAVPGHLRNREGVVRYRERTWALGAKLGTGVADEQLGDGSGEGEVGDRGLVEN
jgi:hypothetical protein